MVANLRNVTDDNHPEGTRKTPILLRRVPESLKTNEKLVNGIENVYFRVVSELVSQVHKKSPQIHSLRDRVAQMEAENEGLKIQIKQLQAEYKNEYKQLQTIIRELRAELDQLKAEKREQRA